MKNGMTYEEMEKYIIENYGVKQNIEIASILGLSSVQLSNIIYTLKLQGKIKYSDTRPTKTKEILLKEKDNIIKDYLNGLNGVAIGKKYGVYKNKIYQILRQNNIKTRPNGYVGQPPPNKIVTSNIIKDYQNEMSAPAIAQKYNIRETIVYKILRDNNIKRRSNSWYLNKKNNAIAQLQTIKEESKIDTKINNKENEEIKDIIEKSFNTFNNRLGFIEVSTGHILKLLKQLL